MININRDQIQQAATLAGQNSGGSTGTNNVNVGSDIGSQILASNNGPDGRKVNTISTSQVIDAICEGPIYGWPTNEPLKYIYLDGTAVQSYDGSFNSTRLRHEFKNGTSNQAPLSNYTVIGAAKNPNYQAEIKLNDPVTQQVQIRDDSDGAYPAVEAIGFTFTFPEGIFRYRDSGGRDGTEIGFKIEVNNKSDGSGTWVTRASYYEQSCELTSYPFEWTFVIVLPQTWSIPKELQTYQNKIDDVILFRITKTNATVDDKHHSKMYLKNYTIYSRNQYTYPYTALAGLTIDSKNFDGSIPSRMYELKLLKVKVPSNYYLTIDDKSGKVKERNYVGAWDGTFKDGYWTDNPVWCFYDLVTNERYGLGKYIDSSLLNKWRLYEIAKYCDAVVSDTRSTYPAGDLIGQSVPANSYTFSITSNLGGVSASAGTNAIKEPRFTCNILINSREEAYSVVQRMASLFRGITFFQNGTLEIMQDRPSTPTYLYNNTNVIDGIFSYSSSSAKARHTVAIVKWVDPDDLYSEKLEYVEDYDGIARYGYREIEIDGFGCTSRGQARRIGRHILITEKFELETVSFKVGMEGAIVTPGSLIKIKDSYRQPYRASGRIASATSSYITLDKAINIYSPEAGSVVLWIQTANSQNEVVDGNVTPTLKPRVDTYSINVPPMSPAVLNLSPTTLISPVPKAGNMWGLSYTTTGDVENTSVYKILSVVENNNYEYEITALQHYSSKYTEIESYQPIPQYKPVPLKLFTPPPTEGYANYKFNGKTHDISVFWRSDKYVSGTKYRLEVVSSNGSSKVLLSGSTDTSYIYENVKLGIYYFKVYALNTVSGQVSTPLLIGPIKIKETMPQNNFDSFYQPKISSDYITHTWPDDKFPNDPIKYELWKSSTDSLRTLVSSNIIQYINPANNRVVLGSLNQAALGSPDLYNAEVTIYPYNRYLAVSPTSGPVTSPGLIVLNTPEKPSIMIGDKVTNASKGVTTNVYSITQSQDRQNRWISKLFVTPTVSPNATLGPQKEGDIIYTFKGIMGPYLDIKQPSGVIKQKTFNSSTGTTTTRIELAATANIFGNVSVGDVVINRTREKAGIVSLVSPTALTISPAITGQTSGDIIAYYQAPNREARKLRKYTIDYLGTEFQGDSVEVLKYDDTEYMPLTAKSLMVNVTKGRAYEVLSATQKPGGILSVIARPNQPSFIDDLDEVIFFDKDEVFTESITQHIHPATGIATGNTSPLGVTCSPLFTTAVRGDILVNATRRTSAIIISKISNNEVTLASISGSIYGGGIQGQTSGDVVFIISGSSMTSFVENLTYTHPPVLTAEATTSTSQIVIANAFSPQPTSSYLVYNMTRNTVASVSPNTTSRITVSPTITGQTSGDKIYLFLPSNVSPSLVTAPDGAFLYARPGDIFYNVTRDDMSTIKDVITLSATSDSKMDSIALSAPILGQKAGDEFRVVQGFFNSAVKNKFETGTNDTLELETVANLEIGDEVRLYQYNASKVGNTAGNTITDTGLSPETTYYYWMRAVSANVPFIGGIWKPTRTTGDPTTTLPLNLGNYNTSNDNNADPITPDRVSPIAPMIDLPAGNKNPDSTANIRLYWEWTGLPSSIDGFNVYFWSSNSSSNDTTIGADADYTRATSDYIVPVNPPINIATISPLSNYSTVTTTGTHNISNGDKIRIIGAKSTSPGNPYMQNINNTTSGSFYTASSVTGNKFNVSPTVTPVGVHLANTGTVTSCKYVHQINNLTANYYYNAWIQPYRMVNTTISDTGMILGSPKILM